MTRRPIPGRGLLLASALAILPFVTACGGEAPAPETTEDAAATGPGDGGIPDLSGIDACGLLTASEIEAATGIPPGEPDDVSQVQGRLPMCNWPAADGSGRIVTSLLVAPGGYADYEAFLDATRRGMEEMDVEFDEADWREVSDVGDFGVWVGEEAQGGMLQVYDGGLLIQVDAETVAGTDELAASKELARHAFGRVD